MKNIRLFFASLVLSAATSAIAGEEEFKAQPAPSPADQNSRDIFEQDTTYTFRSDFFDDHGKLGHGDSLYNDFSYAHRFLITGNWYFRAGVEYERFDFSGTDNGLPDHLQTVHALMALEYVVHDHAGAGIEIDPGPYFQSRITGDAIYQTPIVAPGGGLIWLFTDKLRLEGVFPKPALVYNPNDDWEFRIAGNLFFESYRVDDLHTVARKLRGIEDPVVQYSEERAGLQATYSHFKPLDITLDVGCTFRRDFDF